MKKLTTAIVLCTMFTAFSCQKEHSRNFIGQPVTGIASDPNQVLIQEARNYLTQHPLQPSTASPSDSLPYNRASLHKTPIWAEARVQSFSFGKGIVIPIHIDEPLSIRVGAAQIPMTASQFTWLFMYQDAARQWHPEVITRLPSDTASGPFRGCVRVEDWQGHFLKAFLFATDTTINLGNSSFYRRPEGPQTMPRQTIMTQILEMDCEVTDWYACASVGGGPWDCEYAYTEEDCTVSASGGGGGGASDGSAGLPSAPTAPNYRSVGGGGVGSPASTATANINIRPDTSITNNPIVNCVYAHLMSSLLTTGLKSILSAFSDNDVYNIDFTVGKITSDGICSYLGNNNFRVTLNASEADDPNYSRIYLASIFFHEAFHAKLRQKALAIFGEATIDKWPMPIDDMDLNELATYFESE